MTTAEQKPTSKHGADRATLEVTDASRAGGPASLIGRVLSDRYKIEKLLGEGGMGAVYQAEHTLMRKRLAIKVLHPEMSRMSEVVARFEREAMAAAHIDHPNVAAATDFGKLEDGSFFLVLEFIEGISLRALVSEGPLALARALNITRQIVLALVRAHALGIVHRDLKPENVMLVDRDGDADFVKVLDFGIAKVPMGEISDGVRDPNAPAQPVLTQAGMVYGTPEYMAPEQALGNPVDARADLYAVGVMAYEMLTGSRPFDAESKVKLLGMQVTAPVPKMSERAPDIHVPAEVEALVVKLLAKEADERVQDSKELLDALSTLVVSLIAQGRLDASDIALPPPASTHTTHIHAGPHSAQNGGALGVAPTAAVISLSSEKSEAPGLVERLAARARKEPKLLALVAGAAVLAVVGIAVTAAAFRTHGGAQQETLEGGVALAGNTSSAAASVSGWAAVRPTLDVQIKDGIALVEKGDYASGIEKLSALPDEGRNRPEVRRALATAYAETEKYEDCMNVVTAWLSEDPTVASDQKARIMIRDAAISKDPLAPDLAFALLEKHMGTIGLDDMYDIAYGASGQYNTKARDRARKTLKRPDVKSRMTPSLTVTEDIVSLGQSCKVKDYFERARADGDVRTVSALKPLAARVPSGNFGHQDALQCIHDGSLTKTIAAIEAKPKQQ